MITVATVCRILFSAPLACATFFLLFYVPGGYRQQEVGGKPETEVSMEGKLGYYLVMFCLFEGLLSVSDRGCSALLIVQRLF